MSRKVNQDASSVPDASEYVLTGERKRDQRSRPTRKEMRQQRMRTFIGHLLAYSSVSDAARASGITPRQASRWLRAPEFTEEYIRSRDTSLSSLTHLLRAGSLAAIERLSEIVRDRESAATAATMAAGHLLNHMRMLMETCQLEERLKRLEESAGEEQAR